MELAGNHQGLEEGQIRIFKSKVQVFISSQMETVDVDGHVVEIVNFVDVDENHEKLAWTTLCPLCDARDYHYVWDICSQGVRDLALSEKEKFDYIASN